MQPTEENRSPRLRPGPLFTVTACVFLFGAMVSFHPGDWPSPDQYPNVSPPANACGVVGAYAAYHLRYWLGLGGYAILASLAVCGIAALFHHRLSSRGERVLGVALLALCSAAIAHLIQIPTSGMLPVGNGGVVGLWLGDLLRRNLDRLGTVIVMTSAVLVGLAFATDGLVFKTPAVLRVAARITASGLRFLRTSGRGRPWLARAGAGRSTRAAAVTAAESAELLQPFHPISTALLPSPRRSRRSRRDMQPTLFEDEDENPDSVVDEPAPKGRRTVPARPAKPRGVSDASESACDGEAEQAEAVPSSARSRSAAGGNARRGADADDSEGSAAGLSFPRVNFLQTSEDEPPEPYPRQIENWSLPSLELLHDPQYGFDAQQEQFVRGQARILEQTLEDFRVEARVVEIDTGPVITMFELKLGAGIKVSQIAALSNDIARALKSNGIRVVAPIPGKNTIGIEVPNREKERVRLGELLLHSGRRASEMALPLFLGKDAGGSPLVSDLAQMPHMLIAGTTGSGKSVCLNAVILSVLMTQRPDKVKLILIDPKMVELSQYKDVPHLMCPIVTDMIRAQKILDWAVTKMDERYAQLAEARVKNLRAYNELADEELFHRLGADGEEERSRIPVNLPYIVIIIDELADLMMTAAKEVEHHLSRLAQKSRAVGIHIIVATQRPEAKVVTGLIKSNLPSRICFRVASRMDSRIVLDQNGGEVLLGQGDMLFLPPGSHKLVRSQGTFLEEDEIRAVLGDLASRARPEFHPELMRIRTPGIVAGEPPDALFDQAVETVLQSKRGSASLLQRRLTIGYSRASRLIEQMAEAGIVGDFKGSQAREVLISLEQWNDLRSQSGGGSTAALSDRPETADDARHEGED